MEKREVDLYLDIKKYFSYNNPIMRIDFSSLKELKLMLSDFTKFINYKKEIREIEEMMQYGEDDEEVINKKISDETKVFDMAYRDMLDKNYTIDTLTLTPVQSTREIKKMIALVKDKIQTLDLSRLELRDIIDILENVNIDDKIEIITRYNHHDVSNKVELLELLKYLENIRNYITRYDLSPLEICIFVSDLLLEREYKVAKTDENLFVNGVISDENLEKLADSRSITKVFKSDEIVCAGFANLFSAILETVNINSETINYDPVEGTSGHMSNVVYLNDKKYGFNGIFEIDTTWREKKKKDGTYDYQESLQNYFHFARSLNVASKIKNKDNLVRDDSNALIFNQLETRIKRTKKLINLGAPSPLILNDLNNVYKSAKEINDKMLINSEEDILLEKIKSYISSSDVNKESTQTEIREVLDKLLDRTFNSKLLISDFEDALYRVKLIEHSIDKDKYPIDETILEEASDSRFATKESELLRLIFGEDYIPDLADKQKLEIARVELISVLHKVAKDNVDKNPTQYIKK